MVAASGRWAVQPTYEAPGLRQLLCADCGWVLEEEEIPGAGAGIGLAACPRRALSLRYKESAGLTVQVEPEDAGRPVRGLELLRSVCGHGGRQRHSAGRGAGTGR